MGFVCGRLLGVFGTLRCCVYPVLGVLLRGDQGESTRAWSSLEMGAGAGALWSITVTTVQGLIPDLYVVVIMGWESGLLIRGVGQRAT